jgi:eukaryotic-like serine/threonine-protein kinase
MARTGPEPPCSQAQIHLEGIWDDARRAELEAAFLDSGAIDARRHAEQTIVALDRFAARWVTGHTNACHASTVLGEQSTDRLDLRTRCLSRRLRSLAALTELLTRADAVVVEHAVQAAAELPAPESCDDLEFVSALTEPPADSVLAMRVTELREDLARAEAQRRSGLVQSARANAERLLRHAETVDYAPVQAEAWLEYGFVLEAAGDPTRAEEALEAAYFEAVAAGADDTACAAAGLLVYVVGHALGRDAEGMRWAAHARALVTRPGVDPARRIRLAIDIAAVHLAFARYDDAERELSSAIARLRKQGRESVQLSIALNSLGSVAIARGRPEDAAEPLEEALALAERLLGPRHPHVATVLQNLGSVAWHREAYDQAANLQQRALEVRQATLQRDHPDIIGSLLNLAGTALATDDLDRARALLEQAIAILERRGDQLPLHANALHNLAVIQRALDLPEAQATARRALEALERLWGPDHLEVARAHANLGWILLEERPEGAELHFARAVEIRESAQAPLGDVADARLGLAGALSAAGRPEAARAAGRVALDEARRAGPSEEGLVTRIEAWLKTGAL